MTRTREAADKAVKTVANIPCVGTIKNMERCMEAYYTKADDMKLAYEHLLVFDRAEAECWEWEMNKIHNIREQMKERWLPIIAQANSPLSQPLQRRSTGDAGAIPASTRVKIRADLKPKELEQESSPVEFSTWCEYFMIYHSASNLSYILRAKWNS